MEKENAPPSSFELVTQQTKAAVQGLCSVRENLTHPFSDEEIFLHLARNGFVAFASEHEIRLIHEGGWEFSCSYAGPWIEAPTALRRLLMLPDSQPQETDPTVDAPPGTKPASAEEHAPASSPPVAETELPADPMAGLPAVLEAMGKLYEADPDALKAIVKDFRQEFDLQARTPIKKEITTPERLQWLERRIKRTEAFL